MADVSALCGSKCVCVCVCVCVCLCVCRDKSQHHCRDKSQHYALQVAAL